MARNIPPGLNEEHNIFTPARVLSVNFTGRGLPERNPIGLWSAVIGQLHVT